MFSSEAQGGPNIALITIVCSWIFLFIASLSVILLFWFRRIRKILGLGDYLTILALVTTTALAAQTTWAIVDEGQDQHQAKLSSKKVAVVVRVGCQDYDFAVYILTSQAVPPGKSDSMGPGEYICSNERHFVRRKYLLSNARSEIDHTVGAGLIYTLRISCHP